MLKKFIYSNRSIKDKKNILKNRLINKIYKKTSKIRKYNVDKKLYVLSDMISFNEIYSKEIKKERSQSIISVADKLADNIYISIDGSYISINEELNWNYDYINNYSWEIKHYSSYSLKNKNNSTDIKNVWEFSRFYHLVILAQAYRITKEEKYLKKFKKDIKNWVQQNPFNYSVNWTVAMEVSIRVVNLIEAILILKNQKVFNEKEIEQLNNIIYQHYVFIKNNLEKGLNSNNHYLSNLVGLIWVTLFFIKNPQRSKYQKKTSEKDLQFALFQLEEELKYQVYSDGFSYEDSTSYHCLNLEMLLSTLVLLRENKVKYSSFIEEKVRDMFLALNGIMLNHDIPIIGDMDNGRLMIIDIDSFREKNNFLYLINLGKFHFKTEELKKNKSPILFNDIGIYRVYNQLFDAILRCGKIGVNGIGGHSHNDQLSFVLTVCKETIFIDPGTGSYSGDYKLRKYLRSTSSHNTLSIEGYEQNNINVDLFKMKELTNSKLNNISSTCFEGEHKGFYNSLGIIYKRKLELKDNSLEITDEISTETSAPVFINFILDQDVTVKKKENNVVLIKNGVKLDFEASDGDIIITNQKFSKSYGKVSNTKKVTINMKSNKNITRISLS
jgi:Heparinase II/III-like protein/Heparinase II/III N-terminus